MQVVILCGGKGTRAHPATVCTPKPMLPVASRPILTHVMGIFAAQGFTEFVLSLGYRKETIIEHFDHSPHGWDVTFVDTGEETDTGGRILNLEKHLRDRFMVTYGDGLADIRLDKLIDFHRGHDGPATVTAVPLRSPYGTIDMNGTGRIHAFREKPVLREHWINAGFMVFDRDVFDHWKGTSLERHVMPALVDQGLMYAYKHDGFFKSMDTYKDQQEIEQMCRDGEILWNVPEAAETAG